ncbi:unnamed protein product [Owenia fusiformis]|uniref:Neurochondrin n=1 Tax=Owenia fusiformis TaxID=6347 RepID=A0A8S4N789_OWEFU|nr:unnamed protein product [Owenia fusiformis]
MKGRKLSKCLESLKEAKTDNERFAALMLVAKVLKASDVTQDERREIFQSVGFNFINRLLRSEAVPEGCCKLAFKEIAMVILGCYATDTVMLTSTDMMRNLQVFNDLLLIAPSSTEMDDEDTPSKVSITDDCLQIIAAMVDIPETREDLIDQKTVTCLCHMFIEKKYGCERSFAILLAMLHYNKAGTWRGNKEGLNSLLDHLATQFDNAKDSSKFELCSTLCTIVVSIDKSTVDMNKADVNKTDMNKLTFPSWSITMRKSLKDILGSKITQGMRSPAIQLASLLVDNLGVEWAFDFQDTDQNELPSPKFLLMVVHLVCIEVRMLLENEDWTKILEHSPLLSGCYSLLERIIGYMTTGPTMLLEEKTLMQLHSAMLGAFNAVTCFLMDVASDDSGKKNCHPVTYASIRVLGSWMAEETLALNKEINKLIPFLIRASKEQFYKAMKKTENADLSLNKLAIDDPLNNMGEATPSKSPSNVNDNMAGQSNESSTDTETKKTGKDHNGTADHTSSDSTGKSIEKTDSKNASKKVTFGEVKKEAFNTQMDQGTIILLFLLPGFCHLSVEDKSRGLLLENNFHELLWEYFQFQWESFTQEHKDLTVTMETSAEESLVTMTTACGIYLNLTVLESGMVTKDTTFKELLHFIMKNMPSLVNIEPLLVFSGNLTVLGLMLLRHQTTSSRSQEIDQSKQSKFFTAAVHFLSRAHVMEKSKRGCVIVLSEPYRESWSDLAELWHLGMQVLCASIPSFPVLQGTILRSGWIPCVLKLLSDDKLFSMDEETKMAYESMLTQIVKWSSSGKKIVTEKGGKQIASSHKMVDLLSILQ